MEKVTSIRRRNKKKELKHAKKSEIESDIFVSENDAPIDSQHLLISMLLPPAVKMFMQDLEKEVEQLCGARSKHGCENVRWDKQKGSIVLGNQHRSTRLVTAFFPLQLQIPNQLLITKSSERQIKSMPSIIAWKTYCMDKPKMIQIRF